jgi:hypothetical protein
MGPLPQGGEIILEVKKKRSNEKNNKKNKLFPTYKTHFILFWKFFNSHLFWLNSHPGRACLVLRACRSAAFLDQGCEFNQKRCEFKIFFYFSFLWTSLTFKLRNFLLSYSF